MRTTLFKQAGITEFIIDLLLGCSNSDIKKEFGMIITLSQSPRHLDFKSQPRPPHNSTKYREITTAENYREIYSPAIYYCRFDKESKKMSPNTRKGKISPEIQ